MVIITIYDDNQLVVHSVSVYIARVNQTLSNYGCESRVTLLQNAVVTLIHKLCVNKVTVGLFN